MSFEVVPLKPFERQLKRLVAKYPSLKKEITELVHTLELDPNHGTSIGRGCWKIRISIASKGGGKSGGSRVITYALSANGSICFRSTTRASRTPSRTRNSRPCWP